MKKAKKIVALLLCAVLLVCASVAGTIAYLTSTPGAVTNTFTVGQVVITLDESKFDAYGIEYQKATDQKDDEGNTIYTTADATTASRVYGNTYKLIPGHTYMKDPTVHVDAASEKCYLFVKVENGIKQIEDGATSATPPNTTIEKQLEANGWTKLTGVNGVTNVWYKTEVAGGTNVPVFTSFKLAADADVDDYSAASIVITAYAIQADGISTAAAAWTAGGFQ